MTVKYVSIPVLEAVFVSHREETSTAQETRPETRERMGVDI